jgi:hypothetical protein
MFALKETFVTSARAAAGRDSPRGVLCRALWVPGPTRHRIWGVSNPLLSPGRRPEPGSGGLLSPACHGGCQRRDRMDEVARRMR